LPVGHGSLRRDGQQQWRREATSTVALPTAVAQAAAAAPAAQAAAHPRLWLTPADVTRLRGWATEANPLYVDGLLPVAARAVEEMDAGRVPGEDCGQRAYSEYPTEAYAQLFAFMSLIDPSPAARDDYAQRARTLLMHVMDAAAQGPATEQNYFCPATRRPRSIPPSATRSSSPRIPTVCAGTARRSR
jgi:hypothetical protein